MIDALLKRVFVTYKCYEMYAHQGKKVQLLVFGDRSRSGRHLINYRHCLQSLPNRQCTYFLFSVNLLLVSVNYGQRTMQVCS
jgi:hypothetical protein